ncbi:MAG TPA: cellulase family glycosylhydrolase [Chitinophagaceae bacterium]|nr:cellulase family glycosylhydrolase [Chitinophagaceae bacterium]
MKIIYTLILTFLAVTAIAQENTYQVKGRFLTDPCGDTIILRGVNKMVIWRWNSGDGLSSIHEIAKTGANCVRIVWDYSGTADMLNTAITTCEAEKMIPIIELHDDDPADNTNEVDNLPLYMNYWIQPDVLAVVKAHQAHLLLNIVNELGTFNTTTKQFTDAYKTAITQFRNAGVHVPLIIDASGYGQNINMLEDAGPVLTPYDPDHNILYSVHLYWRYDFGDTDDEVTQTLQQSVNNNLPLIVGEFCKYETNGDSGQAVSYKNIIAQCNALKIGYLAWEWGPGNLGDNNKPVPWVGFTTDGTFETLNGWGYEVAWSSANGIHATSVKSHYLLTDSCASLLPVNILSFSASTNGKTTQLSWITATEANNKGFEIERGINTTSFTGIGFIPTHAINGNSSTPLAYQFTDAYLSLNTTYYRLKQLDKDGGIHYSKIIGINGIGSSAAVVYPNPAENILNVPVAGVLNEKMTITITDISGRRIWADEVQCTGQAVVPVNITKLATGAYLVVVQAGNQKITTAKFIKK